MASAAQIQANRSNAQKSTGPRTAEGKERASMNAIKHGLLAREAVIQGEDLEEFEIYREGMVQELTPVGMVETMLAERIAGLSWRLLRAQRLQNIAFAALEDGEPEPLLKARQEEWKQLKGSEWDRGVVGVLDEDAALGKVVVEDFAEARVLDRMQMYERRIESSLYRTMRELRREREARMAGEEAATAAKLGSFGADTVAEEMVSAKREASDATCRISSEGSDCAVQPSHINHPKITPHGVTTNCKHERDACAMKTPCGGTTSDKGRTTQSPAQTLHDPSCETNPIPGRETTPPREYA